MKSEKKNLSSLRIKQQALYILIFSFVTVVIWISGSLFRSQTKTGIAPDLLELATPLSPTINVDLINRIEQSSNYSDQDLSKFQIYKLIKSKDGSTQRVVPIDSNLNEIPEEEIKVIVNQDSTNSNLENINNSSSPQEADTESTPTPRPLSSPGFGEDGRFYLD